MSIDHSLLMQTFAAEAEEQLTALEQGFVAIEARPHDEELLAGLFRAAHTLKGNAGIVGLPAIAERAHELEDVLDELRSGKRHVTAEVVSSLLGTLDVLRGMLSATASSESIVPAAPVLDGRGHTLRIEALKLDRMLTLSAEISIARSRLRSQLMAAGSLAEAALDAHVEAERLYRELQDEIMRARLVPLGPLFRSYQRVVRDLALSNGKRVELVVEGAEVEIDTALGEQLRGPLLHMLRNALDHGIEVPQVRRARGKPEAGRITLRARREASHIVVEVHDDGAGFDKKKIAERAGLSTEASRGDALLSLVFEPGFSTAETLTELSGRGVGMDVVRKNVEALRGTVAIDSQEGAGSRITLRLPLTLAIIDGFFVSVGDDVYVLPLEAVTECQELTREEVPHADGCGVLDYRGSALPYLRLRHVFGRDDQPPAREHVAIVRWGDKQAGIAVDALLGQDQAVIKPLGELFRHVPAVAGGAIVGDGRVALILDVPALLELVQARRASATHDEVRA